MQAVSPTTHAGQPDLIRLLASGRLVANGTQPMGDTVWAGETYPAGFNFKPREFSANYLTLMGEATFSREVSARLLVLAEAQCRAARAAFQARKAEKGEFDPAAWRTELASRYKLNSAYADSAIALYLNIDIKTSPIFGGKKAWQEMADGKMTKRSWQHQRNSTIYSLGDKVALGNRQIRLGLEDEKKAGSIRVRLPGPRKGARGEEVWGNARLYRKDVPLAKWRDSYTVKLMHVSGTRWALCVSYAVAKEDRKIPSLNTENGVYGVDINPQHLAIVRLDAEGNPIETHRIVRPGMTVATTGKRKHWASEFGKETVGKAKSAGVPVVVEALGFGRHVKRPKGQPRNRKANRMRHNFCYAHILRAILQEAARQGVGVIQVNPAYSSILGRKYARIYRWEIHLGAAMVIGRRGMSLSERQTFQFTVTTPKPRWQQRGTGKRSTSNAKPAGSVRNTGRGNATVNPNHRLVGLTDHSLLRLAAGGFIRLPGRRQWPGLSPGCQVAGKADSGGKTSGLPAQAKRQAPEHGGRRPRGQGCDCAQPGGNAIAQENETQPVGIIP